jgi:hypothetical protein
MFRVSGTGITIADVETVQEIPPAIGAAQPGQYLVYETISPCDGDPLLPPLSLAHLKRPSDRTRQESPAVLARRQVVAFAVSVGEPLTPPAEAVVSNDTRPRRLY